ncbi:hypothetical protein HQ531_04825 [bacterium]|nr:hypothetical protein [bacterium]
MAEFHPFFVHFPIALIMVAVLFDVFGTIKNQKQSRYVAFILQALGGLSAILAAFSGNLAESGFRKQVALTEAITNSFNAHISMGNITVWLILLLVAFRTFAILEKKTWAQSGWLFPIIGVGLAVLVLWTGLLGGKLSRDILQFFVQH